MPETVAAWIATNTLTAASVLTASQITAITYVAFVAASVAVGSHQQRKAKARARAAFNASLDDRLAMVSTAQGVRSRVYGRVRNVDGVIFKATHGDKKQFYTLVIALAGHEIDAVEQVYFNDQPVTLDGSGYVQSGPYYKIGRATATASITVASGNGSTTVPTAPIDGTVVAVVGIGEEPQTSWPVTVSGTTLTITGAPVDGVYRVVYETATGTSLARVRAFTGGPSQNLYSDVAALVGSAVQPSDVFGLPCLLVTLEYDQEAYATGVPQITAVMRGARVFDPRTGTTAWTQNPALIARDWSLYAYGGGCVDAEINGPSFTAAANACDVSTTFTAGGAAVVLPLYQCNTVIPLDSNPDEALSEICESMAGEWGWAGGRMSVRAGVYRAPVATITEDWCTNVEDIQIVSTSTVGEAFNIVRPTLADQATGYVAAPAAEVRAPAYITADGRELVRELELGAVTHAVHAQHISGVLMRQARESLQLQLPCNLRAFELELFDVVAVTLPRFGWVGKEFEVIGWRFTLTGGVMLTLRETSAAIFTPDAAFDTLTISPNTALPVPQQVPQLTGLAVTSGPAVLTDGSVVARTKITWSAPTSAAVLQSGGTEVQYTVAADDIPPGDWTAAPPTSGRATSVDVYGLRVGAFYLVRGRHRNVLGMAGPWSAYALHRVTGPRGAVVFRQASEPAAPVQDGDQWFDTDDGNRHRVRLGGAWVSVRDTGIQQALDNAAAAQATADGKIDSFYQATPPGAGTEGDLWFDTDDGFRQYRYTSGVWMVAADTRIGDAINNAATAQATADGKVRTFVGASAPTAEAIGDLWIDSDDGFRLYRWSGSAWVDVRDSGIAAALSAAADAQATADGKIDTFWQPGAPGSAAEGDIWFDTDDGLKQYRYTSGSWLLAADTRIGQAITAASNAQATADGKVRTFVGASAPTAEAIGDLWLNPAAGNLLSRWSGSAWVALPTGTGALEASAVTEIHVDQQTDVVITGLTGIPYGPTTTICSITFTAPITGSVLLHASGNGTHTTADSGTGEDFSTCRCSLWSGSTRLIDAYQSDARVGFSVTNGFGLALTRSLDVTAGTSYTVRLRGQKLSPAATLLVTAELRVEIIKR